MCGRYACFSPPEVIASLFGTVGAPSPSEPTWNLAPGRDAMVVGRDREAGERRLRLLEWGLEPAGGMPGGRRSRGPMHTVEDHELADPESPLHAVFRRRRCLVPADAFYAWAETPSGRQPFAVMRPDRRPMALAGVWGPVREAGGQPRRGFALVTIRANAMLAELGGSGTMPMVLDEADWPLWLGETGGDPAELLRTPPEAALRAWSVGRRVNAPANDGEDLLAPVIEARSGDPLLSFRVKVHELRALRARLGALTRGRGPRQGESGAGQRADALDATMAALAECLAGGERLFAELGRSKVPARYDGRDPTSDGYGRGREIAAFCRGVDALSQVVRTWELASKEGIPWPAPADHDALLSGHPPFGELWRVAALVLRQRGTPWVREADAWLSYFNPLMLERGLGPGSQELAQAIEGTLRVAQATVDAIGASAHALAAAPGKADPAPGANGGGAAA